MGVSSKKSSWSSLVKREIEAISLLNNGCLRDWRGGGGGETLTFPFLVSNFLKKAFLGREGSMFF